MPKWMLCVSKSSSTWMTIFSLTRVILKAMCTARRCLRFQDRKLIFTYSWIVMKKRELEIDAGLLLIPAFSDEASFWSQIKDFVLGLPGYQPEAWSVDSSPGSKLSMLELRSLVGQGSPTFRWERKSSPRGAGVFNKRLHTSAGPEHATHVF